MAKVSIKLQLPDGVFIGQLHTLATELGRHSKTEAHFSPPERLPPSEPLADAEITFQGRGFTYKNGELVSGTITKVTYEDGDGNDFAIYKGLSANIAKLDPSDPLAFQNLLLSGDDVVSGSREPDFLYGGPGNDIINGLNGDDVIAGGTGDDTLAGNLGADIFIFQSILGSIGNDIVKDFQPGLVVAAGVVQDLLVVDEMPDLAKVKQVGTDTVIDLGDGSSVTLLNVLATDITSDDFQILL
jgi:Ca2+-binding RTX toxin-like protein